jgi:hypothetical protein
MNKGGYVYQGDRIIRDAAMVVFTVAIATLGAAMMTLTSSPLVKGAAFLWLPAALQLMAGVWLGPWRGAIAGGIGAQAAGIIAYGGWAPADFIMNLVAGGFANSFLPGLLFKWLRIDPALGTRRAQIARSSAVVAIAITASVAIAWLQLPISRFLGLNSDGAWTYLLPMGAIVVALYIGQELNPASGAFAKALVVVVLSCLLSAAIGVWGAVVGGQTWQAAMLVTGTGWFLGDTASALLGLYVLAQFTPAAQARGLAPYLVERQT